MFDKMPHMMDKKIIAAQTAAGDVLTKMSSDIDAFKGKKSMADPNSSDPSSATPEFTCEQFYGMPPNSFPEQTPPPSFVYTAPAGPVSPTGQAGPTGQTGYSGTVPSPTPLETIPSSAAPG